jgi:chromosomal replication initiator protein
VDLSRPPTRPRLTLKLILEAVALETPITIPEILGRGRDRPRAQARWMVFTLLRQQLGYSYPRIAQMMGRDHTTVLHGVENLERHLEAYPYLRQQWEAVQLRLGLVPYAEPEKPGISFKPLPF